VVWLKYYIGIDGGGTKTAVIAAREDLTGKYRTQTSGSSYREQGIKNVAANIKAVIESFPLEPGDRVAGVTLGLPLYGESTSGDRELENALEEAFIGIPFHLTNDVEVGWAGSLALAPGINVVAGTGSIAFGKDAYGNTVRCGGWSEFFSDEGSCYWIGKKVMELFSKQSDGRIPRDGLYDIVREELGLTDDFDLIDLVHGEYVPYRDKTASLQRLAMKAARAGSESAKSLYSQAAGELALMVTAIRDRLDFTEGRWSVSYSGGLFKAGDVILPHFTREVEKAGGKLSLPVFEPAEGALLLAFQRFYPEGLTGIMEMLKENR